MAVVYREYESGLKKLQFFLRRFPQESKAAAAIGMYAAAQEIMALARSYAPIGPAVGSRPGHPGVLRAGAYADPPNLAARGATVDMGFAGAPELYMIKQHENPDYEHRQGGKAFFFKDAVDERGPQTAAIIAKYVNAYIRTGTIQPVTKIIPTKSEIPQKE